MANDGVQNATEALKDALDNLKKELRKSDEDDKEKKRVAIIFQHSPRQVDDVDGNTCYGVAVIK